MNCSFLIFEANEELDINIKFQCFDNSTGVHRASHKTCSLLESQENPIQSYDSP